LGVPPGEHPKCMEPADGIELKVLNKGMDSF
jgi:hypothetical protein